MSPEARAGFPLRITPSSKVVIAVAFLVLIAIKLTPLWVAAALPVFGPWRWGFDAEIASFVAIALASVYVFVRVRTARLSPRRIDTFSELSERLLFAGKYAELLFLLEQHFDALARLVERRHVTSRLRTWIEPPSRLAVFIGNKRAGGNETREEWDVMQREALTRVRRRLTRLLPNHDERVRRGQRLFERVFLSEPFVEYLSKARPDFALRVLDVKHGFFSDEFLGLLVAAWMRDCRSALFEETRQNQSVSGHRYRFEPFNPILWYFFGDRYRADPLRMYKPVGDFVTGELARLRKVPLEDLHRLSAERFLDDDKWRSSIYLGTRLFDFWIGEELHRGSQWHGWLMYLATWTKEIVGNMGNLDPSVDDTREFPTGYHFLLYDILTSLNGWLDDSIHMDQALASVRIEAVDMRPDNVVKAAIITTGTCIRHVLESAHVKREFKGYLLGVVLGHFSTVAGRPDAKTLYERAVLNGGQRYGSPDDYHRGVQEALPHVNRLSLYGDPGNELFESLAEHVAWQG